MHQHNICPSFFFFCDHLRNILKGIHQIHKSMVEGFLTLKRNAVWRWFGSTSVFTVAVETLAQSLLPWQFLSGPKASTNVHSSQLLAGKQDSSSPAEQTMSALPQDLCGQLDWCLEGSCLSYICLYNYNSKMKVGGDNDCQSASSISGVQTGQTGGNIGS